MSLSHILQSLEEETEGQIHQLDHATEATIREILAAAKAQAIAERQKQQTTMQQTLDAEQARIINQANAYKADVVPKARGEANAMLERAQAYRQRVIAEAEGETDRFVKVLNEVDGPIVGASVVGPHAGELIHELMYAVGWEALPAEAAAFIHAHPTSPRPWGRR